MDLAQPENKKPLYCFKLDEATGEIVRYTIKDWEINTLNMCGRQRYSFKMPEGMLRSRCKYTFEDHKLGRFVSNKLFTFNPDKEAAIKCIKKTIIDNRNAALIHANKLDDVLRRILDAGRKENPDT